MKSLLICVLLLISLPAHCEVTVDDFCFNSGGAKPVRLEMRKYYDNVLKWSGAYVRHEKSTTPISLVYAGSQAEMVESDRPIQLTEKWIEISGNKISGEYEIFSQGANVYSMEYKNYASRKKFYFIQDSDVTPSSQAGCGW